MFEWVVLGAAALGAAGSVAAYVGRRRIHARWAARLSAVAGRVEGRASPASAFDDPELRATIDGTQVTLRLLDFAKGVQGRVQTQAALPDTANLVRLYVGWDVETVPPELAHVPEVTGLGPQRVDGQLHVRAEDAALARRVIGDALLDLADVRREARARAVELVVRGGYVTSVFHGLEPTESLLERALLVTARLAPRIDAASRGTQLPAGDPAPPAATSDPAAPSASETPRDDDAAPPRSGPCGLCDESDDKDGWVHCIRCGAPYHARCFAQATQCLEVGCGSTVAR